MTSAFAVTWDYRCPFARNIHEHLLTGLAAGADAGVGRAVGSRLQRVVEPHDHVEEEIADRGDPHRTMLSWTSRGADR